VLKIPAIVRIGKQVPIYHQDNSRRDNKSIQDILREKSKLACEVQRKGGNSEQDLNIVSQIIPQ
jgi:hypothetical protein